MARRSRPLRALPYVVLAGAAGYLYSVAAGIEFQRRAGTLGPDVWPKALLALLVATCIWQIAAVLLAKDGAEGTAEQGGAIEPHGLPDARVPGAAAPRRWLVAGGIALTAAYVGFVDTFGFFLSTVFYLAAFVAMGGYRRWGVVAAVSLGGTLLLLYLFMKVVYVSLPPGTGPFAQLTYVLMQLMGIR